MTIGAFFGAAVYYFTGSAVLGFFSGGLASALVALIHVVASITLEPIKQFQVLL